MRVLPTVVLAFWQVSQASEPSGSVPVTRWLHVIAHCAVVDHVGALPLAIGSSAAAVPWLAAADGVLFWVAVFPPRGACWPI